MQQVADSVISPYIHKEEMVSSYIFPSSVGIWAIPTAPSVNVSSMFGVRLGVPVFTLPGYSRKFWLVADAELIVYGATEPDATITIGGYSIELNPDGTFRFQMSWQDGLIDYPMVAVAVNGEQSCSIHMKFNSETLKCHANFKQKAVLEFP